MRSISKLTDALKVQMRMARRGCRVAPPARTLRRGAVAMMSVVVRTRMKKKMKGQRVKTLKMLSSFKAPRKAC